MPNLLLMRHAEAAPAGVNATDFGRSLTVGGRECSRATGALLSELNCSPTAILTSSAVRTLQTAQEVAEKSVSRAVIDGQQYLYNAPAFRIETVVKETLLTEPASLLVVGHNPGIAALMCHFASQSLSVSPGTLAIFEAATCTDLLVPRLMAFVCLIQEGRVVFKDDSWNPRACAES